MRCFKGLSKVFDYIFCILQSDAESHKFRSDSGGPQLLVSQLAMGMGSRMQNAAVTVGYMGFYSYKLQRVYELLAEFPVTFKAYAHYSAEAALKVFNGIGMMLISLKAGILYPGYVRMAGQEAGNGKSALAVALDPKMQALQATVKIKSVLGALYGTEVPHQLACSLNYEGVLTKGLCINKAMI